jgi:hypothetical protein
MRGGCQDKEEEGGLPEDGSGGTADGPETFAQVSPEAVGRRKEEVEGEDECGPGCREWRTLWREDLTSLSTMVGTVATLLAVITPSEGAESGGDAGCYPKWNNEPGIDGLMNLDY